MKTRVAMMFGGKSVEHEVSIISGIQALQALDSGQSRRLYPTLSAMTQTS